LFIGGLFESLAQLVQGRPFDSHGLAQLAQGRPTLQCASNLKSEICNFVRAFYYVGRAAQLLGMWLLLVDLFTAGPLGPDPRLFAVGVAIFLAGWAVVRTLPRR
jgi:hypothetical protein